MTNTNRDIVLNDLDSAFQAIEKPTPLTSQHGSHCREEVDIFNTTDWDHATYSDFLDGQEGAIICPAETKLYLLPRLFRMVILRRHGTTKGAVDNLTMYLEDWPVEKEVEPLLNAKQKAAIVRAWRYLDQTLYSPSGSCIGRALESRWSSEP